MKDENDATFRKRIMNYLASKGSPPDLLTHQLDQENRFQEVCQEPLSVVDMTRQDDNTLQNQNIQN